jgi:hypothetical protein
MKPFKSILHEAPQQKTRVLLFGRMNPITKGHEENVMAAHKIAEKHGAELHVIASHSHDAKKNPLSPEQKTTHLKRAFGHLSNTHVGTSSKESPTILHQASQAHAAGVKHLVIAGGGDRAAEYHKLLNTYNGHEGGKHGYYKFHKISIENTGERKEGVSGTDMRKHASSGNFNKFREGLPSKIAKNEKHSQAMYNDVRHGMGVHEDTRDTYISGNRLRLGEMVIDTFTGIEGKIVYRGPTYVTVQIDEDTSFKRWIDDVDVIAEADAEVSTVPGFKEFFNVPADIKKNLLDSISYCPKAVPAFEKLLGNTKYDQSLVLEAIDATAHYLAIERRAAEVPGSVSDHGVTQFTEHMRHASQLLSVLGVLDEHRSYIEMHAHTMNRLINKSVDEARSIDLQGHQDISDDDLKSIEKHIDDLEDADVLHILDKERHDEAEEDWVPTGASLDEVLNASQRIKKRFDFLKTKSKREIAAQIARHRMSTPERLKKKSITHARTLIMQRLLKGRDKSSLSPAEKDRIENIVSKSKAAVVRISNRLAQRIRQAEMARLRHVREDFPSTVADMGTYGETGNVSTTIDVDDSEHDERTRQNKKRLKGERDDVETNDKPNPALTRLKHFRKMET